MPNAIVTMAVARRAGTAIALGLSLLTLQACSSTGNAVEHWTLSVPRAPQPAAQAAAVERQPVAVVIYREAVGGARAQAPINIYVNGEYQASLVGAAYTEQALCPGSHRLQAAFDDAQHRYAGKQGGSTYAIGSEPVQYFRVAEDGARQAAIIPVSADAAQASASSLQTLQQHTIARVVNDGCAGS